MAKLKGAPRKKTAGKLPSRQDILDFLATASREAGKREIGRAFGVKGGDRIALKAMLREMTDEGLIAGSRRKLTRPGAPPPVTVIEITGRDADGEFIARPAVWDDAHAPAPRILMVEGKRDFGSGRRPRRPRPGAHHRAHRRCRLPLSGADHQATGANRAEPAWYLPRPCGRRRRDRSGRPQAAQGVAGGARRHGRRRTWRAGALRDRTRLTHGRADRPRDRAARQSRGGADDEPHRRPCPRHSGSLFRSRACRGSFRERARSQAPGGPPAPASHHHRSFRCPRP